MDAHAASGSAKPAGALLADGTEIPGPKTATRLPGPRSAPLTLVRSMSQRLGPQVVPERAATEGKYELLRAIGRDEAQGNLVARPISVANSRVLFGQHSR